MMDDPAQIRRRPVIRVFVSSTFADLKHERDALQRDVFPKLEQLCASRQFQFQAIDLRWGVPTEASLDHRTMRICFEELRRSQEISPQPNFLILLGNRYGWRPLPEEVSEDEFRRLEQAASSEPEPPEGGTPNLPHTRLLEILRAWYQKDENAVPPVYLLQSRKKNLNQDYTNDQVWNEVQRVLWDIINRAYPAAQLAGRFDHVAALDEPLPSIVRFQASATEQEIWRGALGAPNARQHVLAFVREIENVEAFQPAEIRDFVDVDESGAINAVSRGALRELKQELRKRLGESNVIGIEHARLIPTTNEQGKPSADVTTGHLDELCARVYAALKDIITRQMDEYWGTSDPTAVSPLELELERSEHQRFGQERAPANSFVGRERHLQAIHAYLHNNSNQPLVIHGASGCGKTALLARAAQDVVPEWKPVVRFIGVTPRSSDVRSLLASLCQELRQLHPLETPLPCDIRELAKELNEHFKAATAQAPLVLFLDALDQLADADHGPSLFWVPQLPGHVKLIVSCLSDRVPEDPASQPYTALKRRGLAEENFINLDVLSEDEAQTLFFERWLPQARRKLNAEQAQRIRERLTSDACRQPLYLKVLFEEARLWRSDDRAPTLGNNVSELLGTLFKRLGDASNHGPTLESALGYIAAACRGLTEMEILEVLYQDPDYAKFLEQMTASTGHKLLDHPKRIPIAIWSRLRFDLAPYLAEHAAPGGTVLNFYHRQVAEFVRGQFLDTPLKRQQRHERLAGYFHSHDYFLESLAEQQARAKQLPPTPRPANVRKVDELPWQRLAAAKLSGEWGAVENLFTDLFFLEAKAEAGLVFDLAGDFAVAVNSMPAARPRHRILKLLEEAIHRDIHFIARHPTTIFQCFWNLCWWYDCPEAEKHYEAQHGNVATNHLELDQSGMHLYHLLEEWRTAKEQVQAGVVWVRSLRPPLHPIGGPLATVLRERGPVHANFSPDGGKLLTVSRHDTPDFPSDTDYTISMWDTVSGEQLRTVDLPDNCSVYLPVCGAQECEILAHGNGRLAFFRWDGELLSQFTMSPPYLSVCAISKDGSHCVLESGTILDARSGTEVGRLNGLEDLTLQIAAFSPSTRLIATGADSFRRRCMMRIWEVATGREVLRVDSLKEQIMALAFSPDENWIAGGGYNGTVFVWNVHSGAEAFMLPGKGEITCALAFSPDGRFLAWGHNSMVRIWDFRSGSQTLCLPELEDEVTSVAFSPDGAYLASGSLDGVARIWRLQNTTPSKRLVGHELHIYSVKFAQNAERVFTEAFDYGKREWNSKTGEFVAVGKCWFGGAARHFFTTIETVFAHPVSHQPMLWFATPLYDLVVHPEGRVWAGANRRHFSLVRIEGNIQARLILSWLLEFALVEVPGTDEDNYRYERLLEFCQSESLHEELSPERLVEFSRGESVCEKIVGSRRDAANAFYRQGFRMEFCRMEFCQLAACLLEDLEDFEGALTLARQEELLRRKFGDARLILNLVATAHLLCKMGRLDEAIVTAREARELSNEMPETERSCIIQALEDIRHITP